MMAFPLSEDLGHFFTDRRLPIWTDNMSARYSLEKWRSKRDTVVLNMFQSGVSLCSVQAEHFPGLAMPADSISREGGLASFLKTLRTDGYTDVVRVPPRPTSAST